MIVYRYTFFLFILILIGCASSHEGNNPRAPDLSEEANIDNVSFDNEGLDEQCNQLLNYYGGISYNGENLEDFFYRFDTLGGTLRQASKCSLGSNSGAKLTLRLAKEIYSQRGLEYENRELVFLNEFLISYVAPINTRESVSVLLPYLGIQLCRSEYSPSYAFDVIDYSFGYELYIAGVYPYLSTVMDDDIISRLGQEKMKVIRENYKKGNSCSLEKLILNKMMDILSNYSILDD